MGGNEVDVEIEREERQMEGRVPYTYKTNLIIEKNNSNKIEIKEKENH